MLLTANACAQKNTQNQSNMTTLKTVEDPFPFIIGDEGGQLFIVAPIESDTLFEMYVPLFEKYGYSGNGYSWEGNIQQILEKLDNELLAHIEFDAEAGAFFCKCRFEGNPTAVCQHPQPHIFRLGQARGIFDKG